MPTGERDATDDCDRAVGVRDHSRREDSAFRRAEMRVGGELSKAQADGRGQHHQFNADGVDQEVAWMPLSRRDQ